MGSNHFTIHNLPYGVISLPDWHSPRLAVAYKDSAVDLNALIPHLRDVTNLDVVLKSLNAVCYT